MEEYESELITITDEDGTVHELEILGNMDYNGKTYYLFVPANIDELDVEDEVFLSIEDDDELQEVYELFMSLMEDEDFDPEAE